MRPYDVPIIDDSPLVTHNNPGMKEFMTEIFECNVDEALVQSRNLNEDRLSLDDIAEAVAEYYSAVEE